MWSLSRGLGGLVLIHLLLACAGPTITPEGAKVEISEEQTVGACTYVDELVGTVKRIDFAADPFNSEQDMYDWYQTKVKNKTAALGGNRAELLYRHHEAEYFFDVYSVYRCT